jgi:hypothetical protein
VIDELLRKDKMVASKATAKNTASMEQPPFYISIPEPNKVNVQMAVYDKGGHESEWVEVIAGATAKRGITRDSHEWRSVKRHVWPSIEHGSLAVMGSVCGRDRSPVVPSGLDVLD